MQEHQYVKGKPSLIQSAEIQIMKKKHRIPHKRKIGLPPGSLVYTGQKTDTAGSRLLVYNHTELLELPIGQLSMALQSSNLIWLDQRGLAAVHEIEQLGGLLGIHALVLEDILNTHQRAKLEEYPNGIFFVLHTIQWNATLNEIHTEQIALFWNKQVISSFQELPDDTFITIADRLKDATKRSRQSGPDYMAYTIIDYIVDSYFEVLDALHEKTVNIQDRITPNAQINTLRTEISDMRFLINHVRRTINPLREAVSKLARNDSQFIDQSNLIYFRDINDHMAQIIDYLDNLIEEVNSTQELYQLETNQRMNNVMKLLTMISTIFIPLSFLAGVYGMNFDYMPELRSPIGYQTTLGVMTVLGLAMVGYFKWKKWI
jgi:magnesium transporter